MKYTGILVVILLLIMVWAFQFVFTGFIISFSPNRIISFDTNRNANRDISVSTANPGDPVSVTIYIGVLSGDRFFLIDEVIPSGWTVTDKGSFDDSESGHLKIVVVSGASDTYYTYTLTAPSTTGTHTFSGTYQIEGMGSTANIGG